MAFRHVTSVPHLLLSSQRDHRGYVRFLRPLYDGQLDEEELQSETNIELVLSFNAIFQSVLFFCVFDNMCQRKLMTMVDGFKNHNKMIIKLATYLEYLH